jgi:hypothetical protein
LSRREYGRALVVHSLASPFALALLAGTLLAGLAFGALAIAVPVALLIYLAAATVTCLDKEVQEKVLERERAKRPGTSSEPGSGELPPPSAGLGRSPRIAAILERAVDRQARINDAIERAELPYDEVSAEVDRLMATIRQIAAGAEVLDEELRETPPERIAARLNELEAGTAGGNAELTEALRAQLAVQRRLEQQLDRFYGRMEEILVEFDTIRGQLVSLSASTDAANQRRLAARVHDLRDQAGSVAEGVATAYADHALPDDRSTP